MLETAPIKPFLYLRYIDDIFLIWTGTICELKLFHQHCNSFHKTIKFTIEFSEKQVSFLDTLVIRSDDGRIIFDLFSKPTDKHCYLHFASNHSYKLKISGPYSQFLRLKRICTRSEDFEKHALYHSTKEDIIPSTSSWKTSRRHVHKTVHRSLNQPLHLLEQHKIGYP